MSLETEPLIPIDGWARFRNRHHPQRELLKEMKEVMRLAKQLEHINTGDGLKAQKSLIKGMVSLADLYQKQQEQAGILDLDWIIDY